jgi:cation diffusion facilitator family transporter
MDRSFLTRYAWLSAAAAVLTIALKTVAYLLTGSVGLLSDAMESLVNLVGALMALAMLTVAAHPPDEDHAYGHSKAEYFSSVLEGALILVAAGGIAVAATERLLNPRALEQVGLGLGISVIASGVNLAVALVLLRVGRQHQSISLEANARHLLTDVWTSAGVLVGVGAVALTGWRRLDPIVALLVAGNIVWTGTAIMRRSVAGLMDVSLPGDEQKALRLALDRHVQSGVQFHALRTRQSGSRRFMSIHVLVPGEWTVLRGHQLLEQLEGELRAVLPDLTVTTHLEPVEDPVSRDDVALDRAEPPPNSTSSGMSGHAGGTA